MERNAALDGLRALAVLMVVAMHVRLPAGLGGFIGVNLFFVLSGFLITGLLADEIERTGRVALRRFYLRRFFRLAPPLAVLLAAWLALAPLAWPDVPLAEHALAAALAGLYLTDVSVALAGMPAALSHTWSLSVEQHFYLLWPPLLLATFRWAPPAARPRVLALAFGIATAWRVGNVAASQDWTTVYYRLDTNLSGLILGSMLALAVRGGVRPARRHADMLAAGALGVLLAGCHLWRWGDPDFLLWGASVTELAAAALVLALVGEPGVVHRLLAARPVALVGLISYAIYLWHFPLARWLRVRMEPEAAFLAVTCASVALAAASWILIEKPLARRRPGPGPRPPALPSRHEAA